MNATVGGPDPGVSSVRERLVTGNGDPPNDPSDLQRDIVSDVNNHFHLRPIRHEYP